MFQQARFFSETSFIITKPFKVCEKKVVRNVCSENPSKYCTLSNQSTLLYHLLRPTLQLLLLNQIFRGRIWLLYRCLFIKIQLTHLRRELGTSTDKQATDTPLIPRPYNPKESQNRMNLAQLLTRIVSIDLN
jgi:hypothetical protein